MNPHCQVHYYFIFMACLAIIIHGSRRVNIKAQILMENNLFETKWKPVLINYVRILWKRCFTREIICKSIEAMVSIIPWKMAHNRKRHTIDHSNIAGAPNIIAKMLSSIFYYIASVLYLQQYKFYFSEGLFKHKYLCCLFICICTLLCTRSIYGTQSS